MNRLWSVLCIVTIGLFTLASVAQSLGAIAVTEPQPAASLTPPPPPPPLPRETSPVTVPITPPKALPSVSAQPATTSSPSAASRENRKSLDGVWEVQVQRREDTSYSHFYLVQQANKLTGTYLQEGKVFPLAGTLDGNEIRIVVTRADGATVSFSGTVDGKTDIVGMMQTGSDNVPFTAAYRPKVKLLERALTGQ